MKDRLFYGMHQELKGSLRYLFDKPEVTYANLLTAAHAAEVEYEKGRLHSRSKGLVTNDTNLVVPKSPVLSAMEDKIDKLTSILKATQMKPKKGNHHKKGVPPNTPDKVELSSKANGERKGFNGRCWKCGGWGHPMRECPSQETIGDSKDTIETPRKDASKAPSAL